MFDFVIGVVFVIAVLLLTVWAVVSLAGDRLTRGCYDSAAPASRAARRRWPCRRCPGAGVEPVE